MDELRCWMARLRTARGKAEGTIRLSTALTVTASCEAEIVSRDANVTSFLRRVTAANLRDNGISVAMVWTRRSGLHDCGTWK
jgi:hypothetical protein